MPNPNYESLSPNGHETMITRIFQKLKGWVESLLNNKADKATTLSGYGITDAKIESGTITLGNDSITPLSSAVLANYVAKAGDTMTGALIMAGQDIQLKTNSSSSDDSSDLVWFYGNGQEKSRIWTANEYSTVIGPNYRIYKKDGTAVYSGQLAIHNQSDHLAAIGNKARLTTANQQGNYDASLFTFLATGSMTTGKPPEDAHIIHSCWDNNGGWDMQLALGHSGKIYTRSQNGGTWTSWIQHAMLSDANAKVSKSGDSMTGTLTFNKVTNAISYTGTKATLPMIRFIDNTTDGNGNGIYIGGGGQTIIGGGESAAAMAGQVGTAGGEIMYIGNDGDVHIHTNLQNGWSSKKTFTFGSGGRLTIPEYCYASYFNQSSGAETPSTSSYIIYANSDGFFRKSSVANIKSILGISGIYSNQDSNKTVTANTPIAGAGLSLPAGNYVISFTGNFPSGGGTSRTSCGCVVSTTSGGSSPINSQGLTNTRYINDNETRVSGTTIANFGSETKIYCNLWLRGGSGTLANCWAQLRAIRIG